MKQGWLRFEQGRVLDHNGNPVAPSPPRQPTPVTVDKAINSADPEHQHVHAIVSSGQMPVAPVTYPQSSIFDLQAQQIWSVSPPSISTVGSGSSPSLGPVPTHGHASPELSNPHYPLPADGACIQPGVTAERINPPHLVTGVSGPRVSQYPPRSTQEAIEDDDQQQYNALAHDAGS